MKRMLYVGESIGEENSALFLHSYHMAELFSRVGYEVSLLCGNSKRDEIKKYGQYEYYLVGHNDNRMNNFREDLFGSELWQAFLKRAKEFRPDLVLFYGYGIERKLIRFCKKKKIKIVIERVDWFSREDRNSLFGKYVYQNLVDYSINRIDLKADGIIAISPFLYDHFSKTKKEVIMIPPVFSELSPISLDNSDRIRLIYAGNTSKTKDFVAPIIESVLEINKFNKQFSLDIIGNVPIEEELRERIQTVDDSITMHGPLPHEKTVEFFKKADFGLLLRDNRRYSKAGFSTKFAEMMSYGIPMICTKVGGADVLIENQKNGFVVKDNDKDTIKSLLSEISQLNRIEINKMKMNARKTAEEHFIVNNYIDRLEDFLNSL